MIVAFSVATGAVVADADSFPILFRIHGIKALVMLGRSARSLSPTTLERRE